MKKKKKLLTRKILNSNFFELSNFIDLIFMDLFSLFELRVNKKFEIIIKIKNPEK